MKAVLKCNTQGPAKELAFSAFTALTHCVQPFGRFSGFSYFSFCTENADNTGPDTGPAHRELSRSPAGSVQPCVRCVLLIPASRFEGCV